MYSRTRCGRVGLGAAQPRLRVKQRLLRVEALTGAGEKKSYVRLLAYRGKAAENGVSGGCFSTAPKGCRSVITPPHGPLSSSWTEVLDITALSCCAMIGAEHNPFGRSHVPKCPQAYH
jgi:hypothetical protein